MACYPYPNFDERQWILNVRQTLENELDNDEVEVPVCIFNVPKTLLSTHPDSYTPQEVAIGPYHCWRPEVRQMERYKLFAAKSTQKYLQGNHKFQYVVDQMTKLETRVRACYNKFLNLGNETLAWMMAIDASFLLQFLLIYAIKEGKVDARVSSRSMSHLFDYEGIKASHNAILRDLVMLENQIPLFVLGKVLDLQHSWLESTDDMLQVMLQGFCQEISPFKMTNDLFKIRVAECAHLLDFLYNTSVPKAAKKTVIIEVEDQSGDKQRKERSLRDTTKVEQFLGEVCNQLSKLKKGMVRLSKRVRLSKLFEVFLKFLETLGFRLRGISVLVQPVQFLLFSPSDKEKDQESEHSSTSNDSNKPQLFEEIAVPSVTELARSQVRFVATRGNISSISFDTKTATLHLPTICLDVNTEVVMRNLVAYEASIASGTLAFTRYTELMNGIIDTEEDVTLLTKKGIVLNRLKSDAEAANLWNGINRSIRLTKVPDIDKVIEDINKYYNSRWKVKLWKYLKLYVFGSWQLLTLLATILLLLLMALQAVCSVCNCRRFNIPAISN